MKEVTLVLGVAHALEMVHGDVIGVDRGALYCAQQGIPMIQACGDFDSVTETEFALIQASAQTLDILNPIKDMTDFTYAYSLCNAYERIWVVGALGGRKDHELLVIKTCKEDKRIIVVDAQNRLQRYDKGTYQIAKEQYQYFSMFALEPTVLTLIGFKYPLDEVSVTGANINLTSNEIMGTEGTLIISAGSVLVIQSKDARA